MIQQITLFAGSAQQTTVNLVTLPATPGLKTVEFTVYDAIAAVSSSFTGQTQTQARPGADNIMAKCALPPMKPASAAAWKAWMMEMRGMQNAVQLGDPDAQTPSGIASGHTGVPVCSTTGTTNLPMSQTLVTRAWKASQFRLLLPGDALQIGYRMHYVLDQVNSDGNGNATIAIFPSLREQPPDGTRVILNQPKALFRLGRNDRGWTRRIGQMTDMSFSLTEFR